MKKTKSIFYFVLTFILLVPCALVLNACSCSESKVTNLKVIIQGREIAQNDTINIDSNSNFEFSKDMKVFAIYENGEEKAIQLKNDNNDGYTLETNLPNKLAVGKYEAKISYKDIKDFKININVRPFANVITNISDISKIYDGNPVEIPSFECLDKEHATIEWFLAGETPTKLEHAPVNAGNYFVEITSTSSSQYIETKAKKDFVIEKATPILESEHTPFKGVYDSKKSLSFYTLSENYRWKEGTIIPTCDIKSYTALYNPDRQNYNDLEVEVTINLTPQQVSEPTSSTIYTYNGNEQIFDIVDTDLYTVSNNKRTNAGTQKVTVSLKDKVNFVWANGNSDDLSFDFTIQKATPTYTSPESVKVVENTLLKDIDLPANFSWQDDENTSVGSKGQKTFKVIFTPIDNENYDIVRHIDITIYVLQTLKAPEVTGTYTYSGNEQSVSLSTYDSSIIDVSGKVSATNAGSYEIIFSIKNKDEYIWEDNTTEDKNTTWTIDKATIILTAKESGAFSPENLIKEYNGNYLFTAKDMFENLSKEDLPFYISCDTADFDINNELSGSFAYSINEHYVQNYPIIYKERALTSFQKELGTGYIAISYTLENSQNFELDEQLLIYAITIQKQVLKIEGNFYTDSASTEKLLKDFEIKTTNGYVYADIANSENDITTTKTKIEGTWAWETPELSITKSGKHTAIFTPTESTLYDSITLEIQITISVEDNTSASIQIEGKEKEVVVRQGDSFSYESTAGKVHHYIFFEIPALCNAYYSVKENGNIIKDYTQYNHELGIIIYPNTFQNSIVYNNIYEIIFTLHGAIEKELHFNLTITQKDAIVYINGKEWNGQDKTNYNDKITVEIQENANIDYYSIANAKTDYYIVEPRLSSVPINFYRDGKVAFTLYIAVNYKSPFSNIHLDSQSYSLEQNSIYITHNLTVGQDNLEFELVNKNYNITNILYYINDSNAIYLDAGVYNGSINAQGLKNIRIIVFYNDTQILEITINVRAYTNIKNIRYHDLEGSAFTSNEDSYFSTKFLEKITLELSNDTYTYQIKNKLRSEYNITEISPVEYYIIEIYNAEQELIETREITVYYSLEIEAKGANNEQNFPLYQNSEDYSYILNSTDAQSIKFSAYNSNYTLELYKDGQKVANNTINTNIGIDRYNYKLIYNHNDKVYTYENNLTVFTSKNGNVLSAFKDNILTIYLNSEKTTIQTITLSENMANVLNISVAYSIDDIISMLNANIQSELNDEYTATAVLNTDNKYIQINILYNSEEFGSLYILYNSYGNVDNNTLFTSTLYLGISNNTQPVSIDHESKTIVVNDLKTLYSINFKTINSDAMIELWENDTLVKYDVGYLYLDCTESKQYTLKIIATDKTEVEYSLTLNGTFEPIISLTIEDEKYEANSDGDSFVGFFETYDYNLHAYTSNLPLSIVQDKTTIDVGINLIEGLFVYKDFNTLYPNQENISCEVKTAQNGSKYIEFYIGADTYDKLLFIIYFDK